MVMLRFITLILLSASCLYAQFEASRAARMGMGGGVYNPFGGAAEDPSMKDRVVLFDVTKVGVIGRAETRERFSLIWSEFRKSHAIDVRGCFAPAKNSAVQDDLFTQNAFQHYVIRHAPSIVIHEVEDCKPCGGKGTKPRRGVELEIVQVVCDACEGKRQLKYRTAFRLLWPGAPSAKLQMTQEMRDAIGFDGQLKHESSYKEKVITNFRFVPKPLLGFGVSDLSMSKTKGKLDLMVTFSGKPSVPADRIGYEINFYSEPDGRGRPLAAYDTNDAPLENARLTFAQLSYPGVVPESYRVTEEYYSEALERLAVARSVVVRIKSASSGSVKLGSAELEPRVFAIQTTEGAGQVASTAPVRSRPVSYGSGLVFTGQGHVFTNCHVIDGSTDISVVVYSNGQLVSKLPATIISKDAKLDLAILQVKGWSAPKGAYQTPPRVVSSANCKVGDPVFVFGFPFSSTLSSNVKYNKGDISDLAGIDDDSSKIQHSVPIQPGNSGGPMALMDGRVIGVVVGSLNPIYTIKRAGVIPQGVNFSIKSDYLLTMAKMADVEVPDYPLSPSPIDHVKSYTVQIMCE
jgi:S1-C subfamily serine protease